MPGSPVFGILQHAAKHILPLTIDADSVDFTAANCATYHDIARYCHEKAASAMFALGAEKQFAPLRVKQLRDAVLKQFWVVNLSDGFTANPSGPVVDIEQIASCPMLALWRGMNAYPWQGPPPVDGKGFLAVLFEATANPHLDPAAQTAYFSEKNYFMISREYCSLHSRFGFHFVSVEARLGERRKENYLLFQLRGVLPTLSGAFCESAWWPICSGNSVLRRWCATMRSAPGWKAWIWMKARICWLWRGI